VKRGEIRRTSAKRPRYRSTGPPDEVVDLVLERDFSSCALCGGPVRGERGRDWSVQHRLRRGNGGTVRAWVNLPGNLILLCGSGTTLCHGRVERHRTWAAEQGYRVVDGKTLPSATRLKHAVHGWAVLADDGTWEAA
jgi:hypothetical protein